MHLKSVIEALNFMGVSLLIILLILSVISFHYLMFAVEYRSITI